MAALFALVGLVALPVVFGLLQSNDYVRTSFQVESLRKEKLVLQERYRRLRIEKATLESLGRIEKEARKRGFCPAAPSETIVFTPSSFRPGSAAPARASLRDRTDLPGDSRLRDSVPITGAGASASGPIQESTVAKNQDATLRDPRSTEEPGIHPSIVREPAAGESSTHPAARRSPHEH